MATIEALLAETGAGRTSLLARLRKLVAVGGLPVEPSSSTATSCGLRGRVWKLLLGVERVDAKRYAGLVALGEHPDFGQKISNDTFRTFPSDDVFTRRVPEVKLIRVLNAFAHAHAAPDRGGVGYLQGMNVLCAPLLFALPEPDAFAAFEALAARVLPAYLQRNLEGAKAGCALVGEVLAVADPALSEPLGSSQPRT